MPGEQEGDHEARTRAELVAAGRILAALGALDSFGHVSIRDPADPQRFLLPRVRAAELVTDTDLRAYRLDGSPVDPSPERAFAERQIHACIYRARPDVMAVCHHHAPAMLPFCVTGTTLRPLFHLGATMGGVVPLWDSQDEFGDTNLLVSTEAQGMSLARALGLHWTVLMRGHGVTVAGRSVRELVFRAVYGMRNAELHLRAAALGPLQPLTQGEAEAAGAFNLTPLAMDRAWEQWSGLLRQNPA